MEFQKVIGDRCCGVPEGYRRSPKLHRGILTILSVPLAGRWSGRRVNQTNGNAAVNLGGQFDGSNMTLVNGSYSEKWTGTCNARGIGGRVNDDQNETFLIW